MELKRPCFGMSFSEPTLTLWIQTDEIKTYNNNNKSTAVSNMSLRSYVIPLPNRYLLDLTSKTNKNVLKAKPFELKGPVNVYGA
jgi:hypothetical protein